MDQTKPGEPGRTTGVLAWTSVGAASAVLGLGALITTFGVGMSDPVWPTEPWFLATNGHVWVTEPARGFLIEHTHRLVAWGLGLVAVAFAASAWRDEPTRPVRHFGLITLGLLLVSYLVLHGEMRSAWQTRLSGGGLTWPGASVALTALGATGFLAAAAASWLAGSPGRGVRLLASLTLVFVMAQGLLGGFRVYLHQLIGPELAAIHGAFGQVTFACLLASAALASRPVPLRADHRRTLAPLAWGLLAACVFQLVGGVLLRHFAHPVAQRVHLFSATLVVALVVALVVRLALLDSPSRRLKFFAYHFAFVLAVQVYLGIEAYLGKFAVTGIEALVPIAERPVTLAAAAVRTGHTLIGAALLGSAAVLVVRVAVAAAQPRPRRRPRSMMRLAPPQAATTEATFSR